MGPARLNLVIDLGIHTTTHSGFWVYAMGVLRGLAPFLRSEDLSVEALGAGPSEMQEELKEFSLPGFNNQVQRLAAGERRLRLFLNSLRQASSSADLVHGLAQRAPRHKRRIVTVHDFLQMEPPLAPQSTWVKARTAWYRRELPALLKRCAGVVAPRPAIAERASQWCKGKVTVISPALNADFLVPAAKESGAREGLVVFASNDPRKNLYETVRAIRKVDSKLLIHVVATRAGAEHARDLLRSDAAILLNVDIPVSELIALYRKAQGVVFPSLGEGFGYPIYEGLSQGAPVVCERDLIRNFLKPFVGSMIFECDPRSHDSIATAVRALKDEVLPSTRAVVSSIIRQELNPLKLGKDLMEFYREVLK